MPDLVGLTAADAEAALADAGLVGDRHERHSDTVPVGVVMNQSLSPAAGALVEPGRTIVYVVSLGPEAGEMTP